MKKYKFELEKITGKMDDILIEGVTEKDALTNISNKRFVMDLKTMKSVNTDHIVSIKFVGEVKD